MPPLHVFPKIGKLPADKVTLHEWLGLLEKQAEMRPGIAERILINAKQMLKWGVRRRLIAASPLAGINAKEDLQIKKVPGSRTLSSDEIVRVWRAIEQSRIVAKNKLFLKLCLIYGCRNGELRLSEKKATSTSRRWSGPCRPAITSLVTRAASRYCARSSRRQKRCCAKRLI